MDLFFIGTGGQKPLLRRRLASALVRENGEIILIDAGEGTQLGIIQSKWGVNNINTVLLTHYHTDHILGLPGVLLMMKECGKTTPLTVVGPPGLEKIVKTFDALLPNLSFPVYLRELSGDTDFLLASGLEIDAFRLDHGVVCYGYSFYQRHLGKFDQEKAGKLDQKFIPELGLGRAVRDGSGRLLTTDDIMGEERLGVKFTYVTDTRPTEDIVRFAKGSNVLVCEGTYSGLQRGDTHKNLKNKHMTFEEAMTLAKKSGVEKLYLTHFSPSIVNPCKDLEKVKSSRCPFQNTFAATDGLVVSVENRSEKLLRDQNFSSAVGAITIENPYKFFVVGEGRKKEDRPTNQVIGKRRDRG